MSDSSVIAAVRDLVTPILADLGLELYDVERASGTLRVLVDSPKSSDESLDIDKIALVSRLVSRELDHADPVPGRFTLEVSSPGIERRLRTPAHFAGAIGETVAVRLRDVANEDRRVEGRLVAADDRTITVRVGAGPASASVSDSGGEADDAGAGDVEPGASDADRVVELEQVDRARTTFDWDAATKRSPAERKQRAPGKKHPNNQRKEKRSS